jgi:hypothetical protein
MIDVATSTGIVHNIVMMYVQSHKVTIKHEMPQPAKLVYMWGSTSSYTIQQKQSCKK